jgi:hypothetical protein
MRYLKSNEMNPYMTPRFYPVVSSNCQRKGRTASVIGTNRQSHQLFITSLSDLLDTKPLL